MGKGVDVGIDRARGAIKMRPNITGWILRDMLMTTVGATGAYYMVPIYGFIGAMIPVAVVGLLMVAAYYLPGK